MINIVNTFNVINESMLELAFSLENHKGLLRDFMAVNMQLCSNLIATDVISKCHPTGSVSLLISQVFTSLLDGSVKSVTTHIVVS